MQQAQEKHVKGATLSVIEVGGTYQPDFRGDHGGEKGEGSTITVTGYDDANGTTYSGTLQISCGSDADKIDWAKIDLSGQDPVYIVKDGEARNPELTLTQGHGSRSGAYEYKLKVKLKDDVSTKESGSGKSGWEAKGEHKWTLDPYITLVRRSGKTK